MKKICFKIFLFSIILIQGSVLFCEGTNSGNILIQSLSAKSQGMGEAYTALSIEQGELTSFQYNPASLGFMQRSELSSTLKGGVFGDNLGALSYGTPLTLGNVAGTFLYYSFGDTEYIDGAGAVKTVNAQRDYGFILSYSLKLWPTLSLGMNGKFLKSELAESFNASTFAADGGALLKLGHDFSLGLAIQNFGTGLKYDRSNEELPFTIRGGISHEHKWGNLHKTLADVDVIKRRDESILTNLGTEYLYDDGKFPFALRVGYRFGEDAGKLNAGFGLPFKHYRLDYSMQIMGGIGSSHFFTLGYLF